MNNLNQQRLDSLKAQLNMALSCNAPSKMRIAMIRAEIAKLSADCVPVEPEEVYSPHTEVRDM